MDFALLILRLLAFSPPALIAQLDRALGYGPRGWGFESSWAHQNQEVIVITEDERWMKLALQEAEVAFQEGEIPVGAIVVREERVVGRGHNQVEMLNDPTAHAEIIALGAAATALQSWRLCDCDLYVTLESCPMCAGATVEARLRRLVFGAFNLQEGACGSLWNIVQDERLEHQVELTSGVLERECGAILKSFFAELRQAKK